MSRRYKIAYCTPSLYIPGGVERVLTTKANYLADVLGYDVYIILTDGKGKDPYYQLSSKIHIINLNIDFEELWNKNFVHKIILYLIKQRIFKKNLAKVLYEIEPDFTISLLRREINFISKFKDGSLKIGELHINRNNYRNFEENDTNIIKRIFSKIWMKNLITKLKKLDRFVVLTNEDRENWMELSNISVIKNPLSVQPEMRASLNKKKVIAVGRYTYQKGFDLLLKSWSKVVEKHGDWHLYIYGTGDKKQYIDLARKLNITDNCHLEDSVKDINSKYIESSVFAFSSRFEGFGMVLVEAMACGLPCVSFSCPCGPKDIIQEGENGFLIDNFDIDVFAQRLNLLIEDEKLRSSMADKALYSSEQYNIAHIGEQWKTLFDKLYSEKHG